MSINLDLQNWYGASSPPPLPRSSTMMNRSAADKVDSNADNEVRNRCYLKLSKTCTEEEQQQGLSMESSIPVFTSEEEEHQMLNFSAGSHKVPHLPHFYNNSASQYYNNPNFTGNNKYFERATNMHDLFNGPFTPCQWMELEQQALIYKHITSNMPVPSTLLIPIRRHLNHAAFSCYNSGHFSSMDWGGFHLGLQNYNNDPEPGRCRRTDGKKWRCSRDAVADQKYCERHINRGRHRSRKPVEGQSRYSVGKQIPASSAVLAGNIGSGSNFLISEKRKISLNEKNLHDLGTSESVAINSRNSFDARVGVDSHNLLVPPPSLVLHPRESLYNIHNGKPGASYAQLFGSDFGLVSSDALKNPSGQSIIMRSKSYEDKNVTTERIRPHPPSTRQFIDDCPKNQPDHTSTMWPNLDDTQLSISIPTAYHHMKDGPSPLTLAWEFDSMPKGLELGGSRYTTDQQLESDDKHPNWIPILRDSIVGGPLGEVLQNSAGTNNSKTMNTSAGLNLMTDGWDKCPTGVLQKEAAFGFRTNSSARAETGMAPAL